MTKPPNIILCAADQLRAFELGCYGNRVIRTPNVDRLAREGVRFETAVTNFPICMAARSVLLSGQYNRWCTGGASNVSYPGKPGDFVLPEYPEYGRPHLPDLTLAEGLRGLGYHTAVIGKWHIHSWPDEVGFDDYLIPRVHHCHSGQSFTHNGGPEFVPPGFSVDYESEQVEDFLKAQAKQERPFFLYYNISVPHCPIADAPEHYLQMYDPAEVPLRLNVDPETQLMNQNYWFKVYRWDFRFYHLGLPYTQALPAGYSLRHLIAEYYGVTTWMDEAVGRMLRSLEAQGLAQDTLVLFTADHGDNLGSHGLVQKGVPLEEAARIPLVVRWPGGIPGNRVISGTIPSLVDIAPTLLALAGGSAPAYMHGKDFSAILEEREIPADRDYAMIETGSGVGVRTPEHLYFLPWKDDKRELGSTPSYFFDVRRDPYQLRNLAGTMEQASKAQELDTLVRSWHANHKFRDLPNG